MSGERPAGRDATAARGWRGLRELTEARVALGRAGDALTTADELALRAAHAAARDAVHQPLDLPELARQLAAVAAGRLGEPLHAPSVAPDRATYLQRPDLGRTLDPATALPPIACELAVVVADGLSPLAVQRHAAPLLEALLARLDGWTLAPPVIATQARVALGDEIGAALGAQLVIVLIGERPGLSAADSLGIYMTWAPRKGRSDAERNCISNVRTPGGQSYDAAARTLAALLHEARRRRISGVALKDDGPLLPA